VLSTLFTRLPGLAAFTPPGITASVPIRQIGPLRHHLAAKLTDSTLIYPARPAA